MHTRKLDFACSQDDVGAAAHLLVEWCCKAEPIPHAFEGQTAFGVPFDPIPADLQLSAVHINSFGIHTWSETERSLLKACFEGYLPGVTRILDAHPELDVNCKDTNFPNEGGQTFLYAACRGNHCNPEVVRQLFLRRASAKVPSLKEESLPTHAIVANFVDQSDISKQRASDQADYFKRLKDIAIVLCENAADFHSHDKFGHSPLAELKHFHPAARRHPRYKEFYQLISGSSMKIFDVRVVVISRNHDPRLSELILHLIKQPKLPEILAQSISERLWKSFSQDRWGIPVPGNTGQTVSASDPRMAIFPRFMYLNPSTLELNFFESSEAVSLIVCNWPRECSRFTESPRVVWQWLPPLSATVAPAADVQSAQDIMARGSNIVSEEDTSHSVLSQWIKIDSESVILQLNEGRNIIASGSHKYKLGDGFVLKTEEATSLTQGPLHDFRIRWVPDCKFDDTEVESKFDEVESDGGEGEKGVVDEMTEEVRHQLEYQKNLIDIAALPPQLFEEECGVRLEAPVPAPSVVAPQHENVFVTRNLMNYRPSPRPHLPAPLPDNHAHIANRKSQLVVEYMPIPDQFFNPTGHPAPRHHLTAKLNSDLAVKFRSTNPCVAVIEDDIFVRAVGTGTAIIVAYNGGNDLFLPSEEGLESQQHVIVHLLFSYTIHAPETKLSKAYSQLYSRLPKVLGSTSTPGLE